MYLMTSDLAGLLAQILPAFIVLFVLEQRRFNVAGQTGSVPAAQKATARARIYGWRLALLVFNVLSVAICLAVVQLGDQGFRDLNEDAGLENRWFMAAVALSTIVYASVLAVLAFLTVAAYRIAVAEIEDSPDYAVALQARAVRMERADHLSE